MRRCFVLTGFITFLFLLTSCSAQEGPKQQGASPAVEFSLESIKEQTINLSEYRGEGAVILLFWTTWCPYCINEIEMLNQLYEELGKDNVRVLAIDAGESLRTVKRYMRQIGPKFDVLLDRNLKVSGAYRINGVPFYIFIDKQGGIVSKGNYFPSNYKQLSAE